MSPDLEQPLASLSAAPSNLSKALSAAESDPFPPVESFGFVPQDHGASMVLVLYIKTSGGEEGVVETLAHLGSHVFYAFDVDQGSVEQEWASGLDLANAEEGLWVLSVRWHGAGEDCELLIEDWRRPNDEERAAMVADRCSFAIVHAWAPLFENDLCLSCGRRGTDHTGFGLPCPGPPQAR